MLNRHCASDEALFAKSPAVSSPRHYSFFILTYLNVIWRFVSSAEVFRDILSLDLSLFYEDSMICAFKSFIH